MASLHALAAPVALILPFLGQGSAVLAPSAEPVLEGAELASSKPSIAPQCHQDKDFADPVTEASNPLNALRRTERSNQIRVERRVIIRITPQRSTSRSSLFANVPRQALNARYEERKMDKCIPVSGIAGVQTGSGNQLLLFLRDRRIIKINLEKACRARDYYSGFYVERNKDGKLCVARDKLQSRTGANCEVARMRQLVAVTE